MLAWLIASYGLNEWRKEWEKWSWPWAGQPPLCCRWAAVAKMAIVFSWANGFRLSQVLISKPCLQKNSLQLIQTCFVTKNITTYKCYLVCKCMLSNLPLDGSNTDTIILLWQMMIGSNVISVCEIQKRWEETRREKRREEKWTSQQGKKIKINKTNVYHWMTDKVGI